MIAVCASRFVLSRREVRTRSLVLPLESDASPYVGQGKKLELLGKELGLWGLCIARTNHSISGKVLTLNNLAKDLVS